ncbi:MAG: hypothetical protein JRI80_19720, partial [Deltaproteobacteria bacterium]|nr:hypothetical protein [Deltaproteobacteria bacterium]
KGVQGDANRYDALNFIGKDIVARGDQLSLNEAGGAKGAFHIQARAACTITITDGSGNLVRTIPLGLLDAGQHAFEWDGMDSSGLQSPVGVYSFTVNALDETGSPVLADTMTCGKVTRVNLEGETPILYVGDIPVDFNEVLDISLPEEGQDS